MDKTKDICLNHVLEIIRLNKQQYHIKTEIQHIKDERGVPKTKRRKVIAVDYFVYVYERAENALVVVHAFKEDDVDDQVRLHLRISDKLKGLDQATIDVLRNRINNIAQVKGVLCNLHSGHPYPHLILEVNFRCSDLTEQAAKRNRNREIFLVEHNRLVNCHFAAEAEINAILSAHNVRPARWNR